MADSGAGTSAASPLDIEREKLKNRLRIEIHAFCVSAGANFITIGRLVDDFRQMNGESLPDLIKSLGFTDLLTYLRTLQDDAIVIFVDPADGQTKLQACSWPETVHIERLIERQKVDVKARGFIRPQDAPPKLKHSAPLPPPPHAATAAQPPRPPPLLGGLAFGGAAYVQPMPFLWPSEPFGGPLLPAPTAPPWQPHIMNTLVTQFHEMSPAPRQYASLVHPMRAGMMPFPMMQNGAFPRGFLASPHASSAANVVHSSPMLVIDSNGAIVSMAAPSQASASVSAPPISTAAPMDNRADVSWIDYRVGGDDDDYFAFPAPVSRSAASSGDAPSRAAAEPSRDVAGESAFILPLDPRRARGDGGETALSVDNLHAAAPSTRSNGSVPLDPTPPRAVHADSTARQRAPAVSACDSVDFPPMPPPEEEVASPNIDFAPPRRANEQETAARANMDFAAPRRRAQEPAAAAAANVQPRLGGVRTTGTAAPRVSSRMTSSTDSARPSSAASVRTATPRVPLAKASVSWEFSKPLPSLVIIPPQVRLNIAAISLAHREGISLEHLCKIYEREFKWTLTPELVSDRTGCANAQELCMYLDDDVLEMDSTAVIRPSTRLLAENGGVSPPTRSHDGRPLGVKEFYDLIVAILAERPDGVVTSVLETECIGRSGHSTLPYEDLNVQSMRDLVLAYPEVFEVLENVRGGERLVRMCRQVSAAAAAAVGVSPEKAQEEDVKLLWRILCLHHPHGCYGRELDKIFKASMKRAFRLHNHPSLVASLFRYATQYFRMDFDQERQDTKIFPISHGDVAKPAVDAGVRVPALAVAQDVSFRAATTTMLLQRVLAVNCGGGRLPTGAARPDSGWCWQAPPRCSTLGELVKLAWRATGRGEQPPKAVMTEVQVSHVDSPHSFFVQLANKANVDAIHRLMETLDVFYSSYEGDGTFAVPSLECLLVGMPLAALFSGMWHRALVQRRDTDVHGSTVAAVVLFVDFGTVRLVDDVREVRFLREEHLRAMPFQAISCRVPNVGPLNGEADFSDPSLSAQITEYMLKLYQVPVFGIFAWIEGDFSASANKLYPTGSLSLDLCDTRGDEDEYVSEALVRDGLVAKVADTKNVETLSPAEAQSIMLGVAQSTCGAASANGREGRASAQCSANERREVPSPEEEIDLDDELIVALGDFPDECADDFTD